MIQDPAGSAHPACRAGGSNPHLKEARQGPVGKPLDRVDGPLKVTGGACYAYEVAHPVLNSQDVSYYGQPVAFMVAETFEQARAAAYLVRVTYNQSPETYAQRDGLDQARAPQGDNPSDSGG